jgi:hypothetical protein
MYLFFYMALGLNDSDAGKSITEAIGRGGHSEISTILGFARWHFRAHPFKWPS